MTFLIDFIIAFTVAVVLTPIVQRMAIARGMFDRVEDRKIHSGEIPRLGGIGISAGFLAALTTTVLVARNLHGESFPQFRFLALLGAGLGFHVLGLVDDLRNLVGRIKLVVQVALSGLVVGSGFYFRSVGIPGILGTVELGVFGPFVTMAWIIGITNALNLLDGMDGMSGGISFIAFGIWAAYFMKDGQYLATLTAIAGAGAVLGFLFFNFPPASIFMGDSGSLFLGFLMAVLPLMGTGRGDDGSVFAAAVTICLLPILDTFAAILRRWRLKVSFFTPDKLHLHHKLLNLGFSSRQVLGYIYSACAIQGAAVLSAAYVDERIGSFLMMGSWALGTLLFGLLHYLKEKNIRIV